MSRTHLAAFFALALASLCPGQAPLAGKHSDFPAPSSRLGLVSDTMSAREAAGLWKPPNISGEDPVSTLSRYASRMIKAEGIITPHHFSFKRTTRLALEDVEQAEREAKEQIKEGGKLNEC